jgi:ribosome biogenesis protein BMS1
LFQAKLTKHRFYSKILKTKNPLIVSLGWRRFQTLPIYSHQDDNMRQRYLKYTPSFKACTATFWGPITPQQSGLLAMETFEQVSVSFVGV